MSKLFLGEELFLGGIFLEGGEFSCGWEFFVRGIYHGWEFSGGEFSVEGSFFRGKFFWEELSGGSFPRGDFWGRTFPATHQ